VYSFTSCLDGASFWSISGPLGVQFYVVSGQSEFLVNLGTLTCTVERRVWTERVFGQSRDPWVYSFTSCLDGASFWSISGPLGVQFYVVSRQSEFLVILGTHQM
jgi:NADH:ubiquinone oxidoreductase subunit B-like Fe-S oxidoreductase